jgi:hypothetical protein
MTFEGIGTSSDISVQITRQDSPAECDTKLEIAIASLKLLNIY